ncbi:MAG: hypothetical protein Q9162_007751 [Coniocarpon cinnabarinum]
MSDSTHPSTSPSSPSMNRLTPSGGANEQQPGNNTLTISRTVDMANPLIFSYSLNAPDRRVYYSFVSSQSDTFETDGYEVLTDGGGTAILCPPRALPSVCPGARDSLARPNSPVSFEPWNPSTSAPNFTVRLCEYNGTA